MNVLREVRKINNKDILTKIKIIALLCIFIISSVYAWVIILYQNDEVGNLYGKPATAGDEIYYIYNNQKGDDKDLLINVDDFYPGKQYTKTFHICNSSEINTQLVLELIDVEIFGESKLDYVKIESNGAINVEDSDSVTYSANGNINNNIVNLFGNSKYPFEIRYEIDKNYLQGEYDEDNSNTFATVTVYFNWDYEDTSSESNTIAQDAADSQIGAGAYEYYNSLTNDADDFSIMNQSVKLSLRVRSSRYDGEIPNS